MDEGNNEIAFDFSDNPVDNVVTDGGELDPSYVPPIMEGIDDDDRDNAPEPIISSNAFTPLNENPPCGPNGCSVTTTGTSIPLPPQNFLTQPMSIHPTPPEVHNARWAANNPEVARQYAPFRQYLEPTPSAQPAPAVAPVPAAAPVPAVRTSTPAVRTSTPTVRTSVQPVSVGTPAPAVRTSVSAGAPAPAAVPIRMSPQPDAPTLPTIPVTRISNKPNYPTGGASVFLPPQPRQPAQPSRIMRPQPAPIPKNTRGFAQTAPAAPVNMPPTVKPTLPVINQNIQQQQEDQLIRPSSRSSSKVLYPSLLWDGSFPITNMRKATNVSDNKNLLRKIDSVPSLTLYAMFPRYENVTFLRYLIGEDGILLSYLIPSDGNVRNQWKSDLIHDPEFYNKVLTYNEAQKARMAEIGRYTIDDVNERIRKILKDYLDINADRLSKKSSKKKSSKKSSFNSCASSDPTVVNWSSHNTTSNEINNCLAMYPPHDGFKRVIQSTNPCIVEYESIQNEDDLQRCMIGKISDIQRIKSDNDCAVKYNMIKEFLDETGYHIVKNSKPKRRSRKN